MNEIVYLGNYIYKGSQCGVVISGQSKVFNALQAGVHGYSMSNILVIEKDEKKK